MHRLVRIRACNSCPATAFPEDLPTISGIISLNSNRTKREMLPQRLSHDGSATMGDKEVKLNLKKGIAHVVLLRLPDFLGSCTLWLSRPTPVRRSIQLSLQSRQRYVFKSSHLLTDTCPGILRSRASRNTLYSLSDWLPIRCVVQPP